MFFSRVETSFNHAGPGRTDCDGDVEMGDSHHGTMNGANGHAQHAFEDFNDLFVANYDTQNAGPKMETNSYVRICVDLKVDADRVLFLSDHVKGEWAYLDIHAQCTDDTVEVRAAKDASMKAIVVDRPGNAPLSDQDRAQLKVAESLDEIEFDVEKDAGPGMGIETEKPLKAESKRKRQSREDSTEPKNVRRSKRLSNE